MRWDGPRLLWNQTTSDFGWQERRRDPTIRFFGCLLAIQVVVWTLLPAITQPNPPAETLELLTFGRTFAWGYPTVPPLSVWLASASVALSAPSVWPVYFLSQLCSAVSIWAAWILARRFLHPWTALCAALALMGGFALTVKASEFGSGQVAQCCWTLAILAFHTALTHNRRRYWVATGLCLGFGVLASYGTILLLIAMFAFTVWDQRARRCWDSSWPFLAAFSMLVVVLPHALWLLNHQFVTIRLNIASASTVADHLVQPLSFLGLQLLSMIPLLLVLAPLVAYFSFEEITATSDDDREFARRYLLFMTCLPPAVIFCLALVAGPSSGIFATASVWSYLGIVILMWSHLREDRIPWRRVLLRTGTAAGLLGALLVALNLMWPQLRGVGSSVHFPGRELTEQVQYAWQRAGGQGTIPILAGPAELVQNVSWYADPDWRPVVYADFDTLKSPEVTDQQFIQKGGLLVWDCTGGDANLPETLAPRFQHTARVLEPLTLKWQTKGNVPPIRVGMAVIHPTRHQATPASYEPPISTGYSLPQTRSLIQPAVAAEPAHAANAFAPINLQAPLNSYPPLNTQPPVNSYAPLNTQAPAPLPAAATTQAGAAPLETGKQIKETPKPQWNWTQN